MINNIIIIINSDINSEELIKNVIKNKTEENNIYLIASPNVRFIHEFIKCYEYSFKDWIIHPIDTNEQISEIIQNLNLSGKTMIFPETYNNILNL